VNTGTGRVMDPTRFDHCSVPRLRRSSESAGRRCRCEPPALSVSGVLGRQRPPNVRLTADPTSHAGEKSESATVRLGRPPPGSDSADFVDVVSFDKLAATCATWLSKGREVCVVGRLRQSTWTTADGECRSRIQVVAEGRRRPRRPHRQGPDRRGPGRGAGRRAGRPLRRIPVPPGDPVSRDRIEAMQADIEAGWPSWWRGRGGSAGWRSPPASPGIRSATSCSSWPNGPTPGS
jgi:single-strand DNA-binding protein